MMKRRLQLALAELNETYRAVTHSDIKYVLNYAYGAYALYRTLHGTQLINDDLCTYTRMTAHEMYMYLIGATRAMHASVAKVNICKELQK